MKKENRLKKRKQFNWTFKTGSAVHSKNLTLVFAKANVKSYLVGFSVTKKVGKAVVRNHVKRWLKEAVLKYENNIVSKHTLIFVAKPEITNEKFTNIVKEVCYLIKKANLYKEDENS